MVVYFSIFSYNLLTAQYQAGLDLLNAKKFADAEVVFQNLKTESPVLGLIGISKYYSLPGHPDQQLDSAYACAFKAERLYPKLSDRDKDRIVKVLNGDSPSKNRQAIEKMYIEDALKQKSIEQLNRILDVIGYSSRTKIVETTRNALIYEISMQANTLEALAKLLNQYGNSLQSKSLNLFREANLKLFDLYVRDQGWSSNSKFKETYPLSAWVRDTVVFGFEKALKDKSSGLEAFIQKYPNTLFAQIALDSLSNASLRSTHWRACAEILKKWPAIPRNQDIWRYLYHGYRTENPSVKQLSAFIKLYPSFPHKNLLLEDEKTALTFYYQAVVKSDSVARMRRFINEYPDQHPMVDTIWEKYAARILKASELELVKTPSRLDAIIKHTKSPKHLQEKFAGLQKLWQKGLDSTELRRIIKSQRPAQYFKFIDRVPPSTFRSAALDSLGNFLRSSDSTRAILKYLLQYPDSPYYTGLLDLFYQKIKRAGTVENLLTFNKNFPNYKPEQVQQDLSALEAKGILKLPYNTSKWLNYHNYIQTWAPSHGTFFALQRIIFKDVQAEKWSMVLDSLDRYAPYFRGKNAQYDDMYKAIKERGKIQNYEPVVFQGGEKYSVYAASLTTDEQQLILCLRSPGLSFAEDIAVSQRRGSGWAPPVVIPEFGLPSVNEGPMSISQNGTEMLLFVEGALCESKKTATGWSKPTPLPRIINFSNWQADSRYIVGNGIIYSAIQGGQADIFVGLRDEDGNWQNPINLGPIINTFGDERAPFLHSDMRTLYFSSTGHPGFGDFDLFVSTRLDDTWTNWSEPKNLGLFLNSEKKDWDFKVNAKGDLGYFSVGPTHESSIVFTKLPKAIQPTPVYHFSAFILQKDLKPFPGQIQVIDHLSKKIVTSSRPDEKTGKVTIILPTNNVSLVAIPDKNSAPIDIDRVLTLIDPKIINPATKDTIIIGDEDDPITINAVLFESGAAEVNEEAFTYLEIWAKQITKKRLRLEIEGHTDNTSSTEFNLLLSEKRANAVRDFLISRGCPPDYIIAKGFGESKPIASNETEEGKTKNRRVIFKVID